MAQFVGGLVLGSVRGILQLLPLPDHNIYDIGIGGGPVAWQYLRNGKGLKLVGRLATSGVSHSRILPGFGRRR